MTPFPSSPLPFIGRQDELVQINALFSNPACCLLTLVGPGGIGKTRLALEAARQLPSAMDVHFVPLQPLTSPDFLVTSLGEALALRFYGGSDPKQQLLDYLRDKSWLLVLDNFEHLLDGAALLSEILAESSAIRLLVTSRERLNLVEEWVLEVGGLSYPADEHATAEQYGAVALFVQQAQRAKVSFTLTEHNRAAIAYICRMVGGMPLGIELAAAWVRALSCEAIAGEIERSLDILETPARNVEPRHRTMRAAFEPTWARLSEPERDVFMRLSVFRGGFTREAAEQVAGASLRTLSGLLDKSLVRVDEYGRYDLHELLRQYAADHLADAGEAENAAESHLAYFLHLAEQVEAHNFGREQVAWYDRVENEWDNIHVTLGRSVSSETGLRIAAALGWFFSEHSHWAEGLVWLDRAIAANPNAPAALRAKALNSAGALVGLLRHDMQVRQYCEQALALSAHDRWNTAWALCHMAHFESSDPVRSKAELETSLALFRELGDAMGLTHTLLRRAFYAMDDQDYRYVRYLLAQATSYAQAAGDRITLAWLALTRGNLAWDVDHDPEQARIHVETSLSLFQEAQFLAGHNEALISLGSIEQQIGEIARAKSLYGQVMASFSATRSCATRIPFVLQQMATIARGDRQFQRAAILYAAADSARSQPEGAGEFADLCDYLGETAFKRAWDAGSRLSLEQAATYSTTDALPGSAADPDRMEESHVSQSTLAGVAPLTRREIEILRLIAEGYSNAEIAARLVLATSTVKWYVNQIFSKLDVTNRTQAVARARSLGLIA